jgi:hypothetical protein
MALEKSESDHRTDCCRSSNEVACFEPLADRPEFFSEGVTSQLFGVNNWLHRVGFNDER